MIRRWSDWLLLATLASPVAVADTLTLCEQLLTPPQDGSALAHHRHQALLVQLQDQLRAVPRPDEALANCHHKVSQALAGYNGQIVRPLPLVAAEAGYLKQTLDNRRTLKINRTACRLNDSPEEEAALMPLSRRSVGRYLYQSSDADCSRAVWLAWQNRGQPAADQYLSAILALSQQQAGERGFDSALAWKLDGARLDSFDKADAFLAALDPDDRALPWAKTSAGRYHEVAPETLARQALAAVTELLGLTLEPLPGPQWQVWDQRRYLGQLSLEPGRRNRPHTLQRNLVGHFPGLTQVQYRQNNRWRSEHLSELLGAITQSLYDLAGHPLERYRGLGQEADLAALPRALGLALGSDAHFVRLIEGAPPAEPMALGAGELLRARLALAFWHQSRHQPQQLARLQNQWFNDYYGEPAPDDWHPLSAYPKLIEQGPMVYGNLLAKETAKDLVDRWRSGVISGPLLWERLFVDSNHRPFEPALATLLGD